MSEQKDEGKVPEAVSQKEGVDSEGLPLEDAGPACEIGSGQGRRIYWFPLIIGIVFIAGGILFGTTEVSRDQTPWLGMVSCAYGLYRILGGFGIVGGGGG